MTPLSPAEVVERAVRAGGRGADDVMAIVETTSSEHVRWAGDGMTSNGSSAATTTTVVALVGGRAGAVTRTGPIGDTMLTDLVDAACGVAGRSGEPAPDGLVTGPPADGWDAPPSPVDRPIGAFASRFAVAIDRARARGIGCCGFAEQRTETTHIGSTTGLRLRHEQPQAVVDLSATPSGEGPSAWVGAAPARLDDADVDALVDQVAHTLLRPNRPASLPPGRYEVLLTPSCGADLMRHLARALAARPAVEGRGPFASRGGGTRVGDRLSEAGLTVRSDPSEPGLECRPFATVRSSGETSSVLDTGLALSPTRWITDGVLTALAETRATAAASCRPLTPAVDNLVVEGPDAGRLRNLDEMVAATERALLVGSLWYLRELDPHRLVLGGVTRHGVHLVEDGEIVAALPDFRFNESPVELLLRVREVGASVPALPREWGGCSIRMAVPPLRVGEFGVVDVVEEAA